MTHTDDEHLQTFALPRDPESPPTIARVENRLVVSDLPEGEITRLFVELVGDGLGSGIRVPILVARGAEPGPVFGITAALHGNELNGIHAIHDLFASLDPVRLRGSVVGVVALNVPGLHANVRTFSDGVDLNHIFPGKEGGTVSQTYAHRILERIVKGFDYLIDLHTASFGRINSLYIRADLTQKTTAMMAYLNRPQIIVHNPPSDYTLRGTAEEMGIHSITVEIGDPQTFQDPFIDRARVGMRNILAHVGMIEDESPVPGPEPILCRRSFWMYTDRGGLLEVLPGLCDHVEEGQLVGVVRTAFGDTIREYRAPCAGIVVGRSSNPVGQTGARILHLGIPGTPEGFVDPRGL